MILPALALSALVLLFGARVLHAADPLPGPATTRLERLALTEALRGATFQPSGKDRVGWFDENADGARDEVEDVYFFDHDGDGQIDRVIDWADLDGDGHADRQLLVYMTPGGLGPGLTAFVIEDRAGDSGFWYTVRGEYLQSLSQFRSDFQGDSFFAAIRWDEPTSAWAGFDENPFCFYDPDGDGRSEEALRVSGHGLAARSVRWSFDTDDDAPGPTTAPALTAAPAPTAQATGNTDSDQEDEEPYAHAYDYDLSLTGIVRAIARGSVVDTLELRPGVRVPLLGWGRAREWVASLDWQRVLLTFDENDRNVDPADALARDRWEGVIASARDGFPQVGNPGCGRLDKRYEQRDGIPGGPELYYHPVDGRVHLRGASRGWIDIDRDEDGSADARLEIEDRDGDGYFDTWFWDGNADGSCEHAYRAPDDLSVQPVGLDFASLREAELRARERSGLAQGARFAAEVDAWTRAGRFVPFDSLATDR